jgi:hypothetical protein
MRDHHENRGSLVLLALVSCIVGSLSGFVTAMFRIALIHADIWRDEWIARAHSWPAAGALLTDQPF